MTGLCHPELVEGLLNDFDEADLDNFFIDSQSSLNKASFFFLDQPFTCFSL